MSKLLIIDKSSFHGITAERLNSFAKGYNVLLPYTIMVECITSQSEENKEAKEPCKLLTKLINCVKNGARVGKSPVDIMEEEKSKNAAINSIIDEEETKIIRRSGLDESRIEQTAKILEETFRPIIATALQAAKRAYEEICKHNMKGSYKESYDKLFQYMDKIHERQIVSGKSLPNMKNWWTWQMSRLIQVWVIKLAWESGMNIDNMDTSKISNDIHDIHYVACLTKANGLLTVDKKLVQSLAKAAFPEKDIFCNIDEVPSEYKLVRGQENI